MSSFLTSRATFALLNVERLPFSPVVAAVTVSVIVVGGRAVTVVVSTVLMVGLIADQGFELEASIN